MASPQKENGYTAIANELLEKIISSKFIGSEIAILIFIIRKTYGFNKKTDRISLTQFEAGTKLSRPTVILAIKNLASKKIIIKNNSVFSVQKNWELWGSKGVLTSKGVFTTASKGVFTKTSKGVFTHKRHKDMIKDNSEETSQIPKIIKAFELINPTCSRFYTNKTQRLACSNLIKNYGFERVMIVIEKTIQKTNGMDFFPTITTPLQLETKWVTLESAIRRYQSDKKNIKNNVAF